MPVGYDHTQIIVNDINFLTLMSEVCCGADKRFYLKVQILMSFTIYILGAEKIGQTIII